MNTILETINELILRLSFGQTSNFVGLTYTKTSGMVTPQTSRYVVNTNVNLDRVYREDLETVKSFRENQTDSLTLQVCDEIISSLEKSLEVGIGNNPNFTRKNHVERINGTLRRVICKDGSEGVEIIGLIRSKVVLVEGEYKKVNSSPKTILKNKIKKSLNLGISKIGNFTVSLQKIKGVRENGDVIELCEEFEVNVPSVTNPSTVTELVEV